MKYLDEEKDEEIVQSQAQPAPIDYKQMVRDRIMQKFNPEAREKLVMDGQDKGYNFNALGAGIGSAIAGRGAEGLYKVLERDEKARQDKINQFDKSRGQLTDDFNLMQGIDEAERKAKEQKTQDEMMKAKRDISSSESVFAQDLAIKMLPSQAEAIRKMSAEQIEARYPILAKFFESDQARALKAQELNAKAQEEQLKALKEQQKIDRAIGGDETRKQIYENIPTEQLQSKALQEYGEFKEAENMANRVVSLLSSSGSDASLLDKAKGGKIKGEVKREIETYLRSVQKQPEDKQQAIDTVERFFDANPNASKQDIQAMTLGIIQTLTKTPTLTGQGIRPQFNIKGLTPAPQPKASNQKSVVKKQYSQSKNQTRILYSDGSSEVVDGQQ